MSDINLEPARVRPGMQPENVAVLVLAALLVGLLVGQALGRRQGLVVKRVELPPMPPSAAAPADPEAELAKTAPAAPKTLADARAMVAAMPAGDPAGLVALGDRKAGNGHHILAVAFYEKALEADPRQASTWLKLGKSLTALGEQAEAAQALRKARELAPAGEADASR